MNRTVHSVTKHNIEKMFFQCYIYLTEINYNVVPVPYRYRFVDPHNFDTVPTDWSFLFFNWNILTGERRFLLFCFSFFAVLKDALVEKHLIFFSDVTNLQNLNKLIGWYRLDEDNCLNLEQTLGAFTAPITEQHAWALAYMVRASWWATLQRANGKNVVLE